MTTNHPANGSVPEIGQTYNPYKLFTGIFIPEAVCKYRGLSPGAKLAFGRLCRYAGEDGKVYPSMRTLGEELGIGERQAREYTRELEQKAFIRVDRETKHYRADGSGGTNTYVFVWHEAFLGDTGQPRKLPPPLRKTAGVPRQETAGVTPAENRRERESSSNESQVKRVISTDELRKKRAPQQKPEAEKPNSKRVDDERPKPAAVADTPPTETYANPKEELRAVYLRKTGFPLSMAVETRFFQALELRGVPIAAAMQELRRHVPNAWSNPDGFLTDFARKVRAERSQTQAHRPAPVLARPPATRAEQELIDAMERGIRRKRAERAGSASAAAPVEAMVQR